MPMIAHSAYLVRLFIWLFQSIRIGNNAQTKSVQIDHATIPLVAEKLTGDFEVFGPTPTNVCISNPQVFGT